MKPRPEKKPSLHHILPMELQVGDRFFDETGEWEVIGRPYMSAGGKNAHVRVRWSTRPPSPRSGPGARMSASA